MSCGSVNRKEYVNRLGTVTGQKTAIKCCAHFTHLFKTTYSIPKSHNNYSASCPGPLSRPSIHISQSPLVLVFLGLICAV